MKEYNIDYGSFIGGWFIPEDVCDQVIDFFNENKSLHGPGLVGGHKINEDGSENYDEIIDTEYKKCTQMQALSFARELDIYNLHLQDTLNQYKKKYEWADYVTAYKIIENMSVQHYKPGEGFYRWHSENSGDARVRNRHLVFMTYLNDVENGGTEFYYYPNLKIEARKGLTLIWPAGWTHTHKGVISDVDEKYIITGWYSFYD